MSVYQLGHIIGAWGDDFDLDVHLSVNADGYCDFKVPKDGMRGKPRLLVWINNDNASADNSSLLNHYPGMAPPLDPDTPDDESTAIPSPAALPPTLSTPIARAPRIKDIIYVKAATTLL